MGAEGRGATARVVRARRAGAGASSCRPIPRLSRGLMNKQQSEAPSPWRPRRRREPPPLQGPPRGCRARAPPLSSARCSPEGSQVRTGSASATRAAAAADGAAGRDGTGVPGGTGPPRELCGRGSSAAPGAPSVRPAPLPETRCPGSGCAGAAPRAWGAARRPPRTSLTPRSSPASRLRTSERAFVLPELAGLAAFVWAFLSSLPPLSVSQRW